MILSVNPTYDLVAYAAGCVVVLYNHKLDKQVGLLCSATLSRASSSSGDGLLSASGPPGSHNPGGSGVGAPRSAASSPRAMAGTQWMNNAMAGGNINPLAGLMPMSLAEPSASSSFGASNPSSNKNVKPKLISCLSFSSDGQFLAIGEVLFACFACSRCIVGVLGVLMMVNSHGCLSNVLFYEN